MRILYKQAREKGVSVKITENEVRYVADLANLELSDAGNRGAWPRIWTKFSRTSTRLNEMDTSTVEPMAQVLYEAEETSTLREDRKPPLGNEAALANAPLAGAGYYKVPKVIER